MCALIRKLGFAFLIAAVFSGCLKTRSQLREDGSIEASGNRPVDSVDSYALDELKAEITRLNGRISELERAADEGNRNNTMSGEQIQGIDQRIAELEQTQIQILTAIKKLQGTAVAAVNLYETGKKQFKNKEYADAVRSLNVYLKNPKAKYLRDATFMRAESYYALRQFKKAIIDYSKFPEKYSKSRYTPKALYKIGLSFEALGLKDDATPFYQELADKFPKSSEGKIARKKLLAKKSSRKKSTKLK